MLISSAHGLTALDAQVHVYNNVVHTVGDNMLVLGALMLLGITAALLLVVVDLGLARVSGDLLVL